ncbi:DNA-directed RNA polymerase subunit delta [Oceanobacillus neutriphilus]|uniref:Probable DNA-directed RNA polymerase subunit delta n=1 Tax=Oceanobacillus neutriphilus TaxID=531815 RepID=A0ABQ2P0P7_9BACI|nr:DNA-directed RNA polymerase subunit delta [Oceanobacillus neutriphilus]GGP15264.1 hypothetical protein GCM10011346_42580 [Oceanobacillus neutriphilus]
MSVKELTKEEISNLSMIELGSIILKEENKAISFQNLFSRIADLKNFSKEDKENLIAQFYTDMNVDGRYLTLGSGMWGLKSWYPVEQAEEEITDEPTKKRKKKKKKAAVVETEEIDSDLDVTDEDIDDMLDDFDDAEEDTDIEEIEDEVDDVIGKDDLDELDYDDEDDR